MSERGNSRLWRYGRKSLGKVEREQRPGKVGRENSQGSKIQQYVKIIFIKFNKTTII
jgi:hypothetical protein